MEEKKKTQIGKCLSKKKLGKTKKQLPQGENWGGRRVFLVSSDIDTSLGHVRK
jgi:hypothetical protein